MKTEGFSTESITVSVPAGGKALLLDKQGQVLYP